TTIRRVSHTSSVKKSMGKRNPSLVPTSFGHNFSMPLLICGGLRASRQFKFLGTRGTRKFLSGGRTLDGGNSGEEPCDRLVTSGVFRVESSTSNGPLSRRHLGLPACRFPLRWQGAWRRAHCLRTKNL